MTLDSFVERIPGVGPVSAEALHERGISTVRDMLRVLPYRYIDFLHPALLAQGRIGESNSYSVEIKECVIERTHRKFMTLVWARLEDESGELWAVWFNQSFLAKTLKVGSRVLVHGTIAFDTKRKRVLRNPELFFSEVARPVPRYSASAGAPSGRFAKMIGHILPLLPQLEDPLPKAVCDQFGILGLREALRFGHRPRSLAEVEQAHCRLALDELWAIMVQALLGRKEAKRERARRIVWDEKLFSTTIAALPFQLTDGQVKALHEVRRDLSGAIPMRRLLNGDVGSGKTVVAMLAARQVLHSGARALFLAPTTILASQHFATWRALFPDTDAFLLTSHLCMVGDEKVTRKVAEAALAQCKAAFVSGTQALLHREDDAPGSSALVVVDEQHRFGVMQRAKLLGVQNEKEPHLLSMSATPIPRTAALVLYGDLDISLISQKPLDRKTIITKLASETSRATVYQFVAQQLAKGEQAFVVCPTIGTNEDTLTEEVGTRWGKLPLFEEKKAAMAEYDRLQKQFPKTAIGLLHGKMKQAEKDAVMEQFRARELQLLVSTTVIEVGVDVPNATIMIVEGAEFFGLAQLHQLRGRVGRADVQSYCILFASNWSPRVKQRLQLLVELSDGFTLAEKDLELRGPGELYGTLQAGYTPFQFASLGDTAVVAQAREVAEAILAIPHEKWPQSLQLWLATRQSVHPE